MMRMGAAEAAALAQARLEGDGSPVEVGPDVVIDARKATSGCIFVAIPGERVDGHDFTTQASQAGAAAVIATRMTDAPIPHLVVDESVEGLSRLAHGVVERSRSLGMRTLAITGSSGKTSTKDLLAQVLETCGPTISPIGSFNNEIGVPLTACGVDEQTRFLVSEMGARGIGHIAHLCGIVAPDIAMVLNVGTAHIGEFGSADGIALAKGEIVEALDADGWAILNADDHRVAAMSARTRGHIAWWTRGEGSVDGELVVRARNIVADELMRHGFVLEVTRNGVSSSHDVQLQVLGSHQVSNALASATAAIAAGMEPAAVAEALSAATTRSRWRMELLQRPDGAAILNDCYNANPDSMVAALETLEGMLVHRRAHRDDARAIAVLGDMLELGEDSDELHRELGRQAAAHQVTTLVAVGERAAQIVAGAQAAGLADARVVTRDEVARSLALEPADVVLVKASRGIALESVADDLAAAGAGRSESGVQR